MPDASRPTEPIAPARASQRSFWYTLIVLNLGLGIGGWAYASVHKVSADLAIPIVAAFLLQASVYLVPAFPAVRRRLEDRFRPAQLALLAVAVSTGPYLVYSLPTGVFNWTSFLKLLGLCLFISFFFVLAPPRGKGLRWQDAVVLAALAYPMISGLSTLFRDIYVSPAPHIRTLARLDILGKLMLIPLGATAFLSLRCLRGSGFRLAISRADLQVGLKNYLFFVPLGTPLAIGIGFVRFEPRPIDGWSYPFEVMGTMLGVYLVVALSEELFFRGITQNLLSLSLGNPLIAQLIATVLFGLAHLPTRGFPNWRYALLAAVAGWFYGRAYAQSKSVVASSVTHTLVNVTWRFLFR